MRPLYSMETIAEESGSRGRLRLLIAAAREYPILIGEAGTYSGLDDPSREEQTVIAAIALEEMTESSQPFAGPGMNSAGGGGLEDRRIRCRGATR